MRAHTIAAALVAVAFVLAATGCAAVAPSTPSEFALVQYPDAGFGGLYAQTAAAKKSIDMEMYELSDQTEEAALVRAAHRGITVRVLLDSAYEEKQYNQPAYSILARGGVQVRWGDPGVIFHIKTTVFDDTTADISSANVTSVYYATTRDATVVDTYPVHVEAIEKTFDSDWGGGSPDADTSTAPGLVWSPGAESTMISQIDNASTSIDFTSEELSDTDVVGALVAAARHGIRCRIAMVDQEEWHQAFAEVTAAGCQVHVVPNVTNGFYIHEKLLLTDIGTTDAAMMLGSQNASYASLARNRELSIVLTGAQAPSVLAEAETTFNKDFATAKAWH
jgi:cardiolipin synthase